MDRIHKDWCLQMIRCDNLILSFPYIYHSLVDAKQSCTVHNFHQLFSTTIFFKLVPSFEAMLNSFKIVSSSYKHFVVLNSHLFVNKYSVWKIDHMDKIHRFFVFLIQFLLQLFVIFFENFSCLYEIIFSVLSFRLLIFLVILGWFFKFFQIFSTYFGRRIILFV